jgi:hypothetical protein
MPPTSATLRHADSSFPSYFPVEGVDDLQLMEEIVKTVPGAVGELMTASVWTCPRPECEAENAV